MSSVTHSLPLVESRPHQGMARSKLLRAYAIDAKYEFIRMFRNPMLLIPVLLITPVMYVLFGIVFMNSLDYTTYVDFTREELLRLMFVNYSVFSILGPSMVSLGTLLALERDSGLLTFKRVLPIPAYAPLLVKTLFAVLTIVLLLLVMTLEAVFIADLDFTFAQYARIWAVCIFGSLPFAAIGLYLGSILSGTAANGVVTGAYMTMAMIGGLLFPLPPAFAWVALFSPAFYLSQLALNAADMNTTFDAYFPAALLFGLTVLFGWLSVRRTLNLT